jgi:hypothetical protein
VEHVASEREIELRTDLLELRRKLEALRVSEQKSGKKQTSRIKMIRQCIRDTQIELQQVLLDSAVDMPCPF